MNLEIEIKDNCMLVRLMGEIDLAVTDTLRNSLEHELDLNPAVKNIVINLSDVDYIDSSGLGVLLGRYKRVTREGGKMFIVGASPQVRKIVDMSGLFNIMPECTSEAEALNHAV